MASFAPISCFPLIFYEDLKLSKKYAKNLKNNKCPNAQIPKQSKSPALFINLLYSLLFKIGAFFYYNLPGNSIT
jgi:hypothetical protein